MKKDAQMQTENWKTQTSQKSQKKSVRAIIDEQPVIFVFLHICSWQLRWRDKLVILFHICPLVSDIYLPLDCEQLQACGNRNQSFYSVPTTKFVFFYTPNKFSFDHLERHAGPLS